MPYKEYNKMNVKPLKRGNNYSIMSTPVSQTFIIFSPEQFAGLIVSILGAAGFVIYWLTRKITQLEEQVKTLRDVEMKNLKEDKINNLKEKVVDVSGRCRYIEQKFMDESVHISPEVRKEIKKEEEKKNE
jgi:hypothetical protein